MIYQKMLNYYDLADNLIRCIEENKDRLTEQQMMTIESIVENLEKQSDILTEKYIEFTDSDEPMKIDSIRSIFDSLKLIKLVIKDSKKQLLLTEKK